MRVQKNTPHRDNSDETPATANVIPLQTQQANATWTWECFFGCALALSGATKTAARNPNTSVKTAVTAQCFTTTDSMGIGTKTQ